MDDVLRDLEAAENATPAGPFLEGLTSSAGAVACIRAAYLWESGDAAGSFVASRAVLDAEPEGSPWRAIGVACLGLGHLARGEWGEGIRWTRDYARIGRESGHHLNHASGLASASAGLAELGEWSSAAEVAAESIAIGDGYGITEHWCMAHAHLAAGLVHEHEGDREGAREELERAAELVRRGYGPTSTTWVLVHLARVLADAGDRDGAEEALSEARDLSEAAVDTGIFASRADATRERLGLRQRAPVQPGEPLSDRELDVLRLLTTRLSQREIGAELYVSLNTVKTHSKNIFRKLGASSREDAVARARELGLI
jgi:DNA-binding CsgD family transcriptional regulator